MTLMAFVTIGYVGKILGVRMYHNYSKIRIERNAYKGNTNGGLHMVIFSF
jgi:hypothetical protein